MFIKFFWAKHVTEIISCIPHSKKKKKKNTKKTNKKQTKKTTPNLQMSTLVELELSSTDSEGAFLLPWKDENILYPQTDKTPSEPFCGIGLCAIAIFLELS